MIISSEDFCWATDCMTENRILDDDTKLHQGVKEVMEVIAGLLKDRVEVDDSPDVKRARTVKYIKE